MLKEKKKKSSSKRKDETTSDIKYIQTIVIRNNKIKIKHHERPYSRPQPQLKTTASPLTNGAFSFLRLKLYRENHLNVLERKSTSLSFGALVFLWAAAPLTVGTMILFALAVYP